MNTNYYILKEIKNIESNKIKIAKQDEDIANFIKEAINIKSSNKKIYIGIINEKTANKIYNKTKINIKNYNISLKIDSIKHIISHHSNKKEYLRGQTPITESDFLLISKIIYNFDLIKKSGTTKENKPVITFKKHFNKTYYLVCYISDKHFTLEIQTMYKK